MWGEKLDQRDEGRRGKRGSAGYPLIRISRCIKNKISTMSSSSLLEAFSPERYDVDVVLSDPAVDLNFDCTSLDSVETGRITEGAAASFVCRPDDLSSGVW